ncbi:alpha/beta hydrolase [Hoeflea sp. AS60]|uniref:alpha/beta hydrolase n=1 Tax=Hoeflea sp. AS60 TaxID=3135780 RepID=UPI00316CC7B1
MTETDLYRIRDFVPDFDGIAAQFATRSRALSNSARVKADIAYGSREREVLDVVFPDKPQAGAPLHVFIHGGYWRSGEKADYRFIATPVLEAGGIVALVEYDLMPGQRLAVLVDQVRRAVNWLQDNATQFGADPERITVSGHSAGAHLASYLAATGPEETATARLPQLKGMLLLSGIYDLSGIPDSFLKHEAQLTPAEAAAFSPLSSAHQKGPKRIIAYGADETPPFHDQAILLGKHLQTEAHHSEVIALPGLNHMSVVLDLGDPNTSLGRKLSSLTAL